MHNFRREDGSLLPPMLNYANFAVDGILKKKRTALIARPGSGKTRILIESMLESGVCEGPTLVICSGPAMAVWNEEIPKWSNIPYVLVTGDVRRREKSWRHALGGAAGIYVINYAIFLRDIAILMRVRWSGIFVDEYHKFLRNHKNKSFSTFKSLSRASKVLKLCVLASGSPIRKHPGTMFTVFNLADPVVFRSYWKFVDKYCLVDGSAFGKSILGPKNVAQFRTVVDKYLVYLPKELIAEQLPKGKRAPIPVEMDPDQRKIYAELIEDSVVRIGQLFDEDGNEISSGRLVVAQNTFAELLMLRKLLCVPKMIDTSLGYGGGFYAILDRLEEESHCVIFVPFREACDFVKCGLNEHGYNNVYILRGQMGDEAQSEAIAGFTRSRGIIICTIAYGESFSLPTCNMTYFLGYDFSLDVLDQCEGRTTRVSSENDTAFWMYIKYVNTHDEIYLAELAKDDRNVNAVMFRPEEYIRMLQEYRRS